MLSEATETTTTTTDNGQPLNQINKRLNENNNSLEVDYTTKVLLMFMFFVLVIYGFLSDYVKKRK